MNSLSDESARDSGAAYVFFISNPTGTAIPRLVNISTRGRVETGDNIVIGGFIIGGSEPKKVIIKARGPSMATLGVPGTLSDPAIRLFSGSTPIDFNDNWQTATNAAEITTSGQAPTDPKEAAILTSVNPGVPYTVHLTGVGGTSGIAIVEAFELDKPDPTLELYQAGVTNAIETNDNWVDSPNMAPIQASGNAPTSSLESAIIRTLTPGAYTAIVKGKDGSQGIGLVEVYKK